MSDWLQPLNPAIIQNPVYRYQQTKTRLKRFLTTRTTFWLWTLWLLVRSVIVTAAFAMFLMMSSWNFYQNRAIDGTLVVLLGIFSLLPIFISDFAGFNASVRVFDQAVADSEFKLEDLTDDPHTSVSAYHTLARLHIWRMTMWIVGLRLVVVGLAILNLTEEIRDQAVPFFDYAWSMEQNPAAVIGWLLVMLIAGAVFILEPCWRTRLTTAYGLSAVTRYNPDSDPLFAGRGFWLTAAYWIGLFGLYTAFIQLPGHWFTPSTQLDFPHVIFTFLGVGGIFIALFVYNQRLTHWYLEQATHNLSKLPALLERQTQAVADQASAVRFPKQKQSSFWKRFFIWRSLFHVIRSGNPVFVMDARPITKGSTFRSLRKWSLQTLTRLTVVTVVLGLGLGMFMYYQSTRYNASGYYSSYIYDPYYYLQSVLSAMGAILAIISIFADGMLDFACITAAHTTINRDMVAGRWDLLRITMLPETEIVVGKHTITQIRAWRMLSAVMGMRFLSIVIFVMLGFIRPSYEGAPSTFEGFITQLYERPLSALVVAAGVIWFCLIYLLEPLWRHHTMTALGLAVSSGRNTLNGLLTGFATIFGVWITQGITVMALVWTASTLFSIMSAAFYSTNYNYNTDFDYEAYANMQIVLTMIVSLITGMTIFGYYTVLRNISIDNIMRRAFRG